MMPKFSTICASAFVIALCACSPSHSASGNSCDAAAIGLKASQLRLDYSALAPSPVAEILSQAEAEYLQNANYFVLTNQAKPKDFPAIWRKQVKALLKGPLPEAHDTLLTPSVSFFRFLTPENFQRLRACAPADHPKIGYLTRLKKFPPTGKLNN